MTVDQDAIDTVAHGARIVLAERRLSHYCALMDPSYVSARHTQRICHELERLERGETDRLAIFMPPRHGKTMHVSQRFPAWYLGRNPSHQLIIASYGAELAEANSRAVRNQLTDDRYPFAVQVASDSAAVNRWGTTAGGVVIAAGVGGAMTGFGAQLLLIDDPVKGREEADSETYRERAWQWYTEVARTRLMPGGKIVVCQTRWHEDDLSGRILASSPGRWHVLDMPALDDDGNALWPGWFSAETLAEIRQDIGDRAWQALYQQRPTAAEGGMFKRAWFTSTYTARPRLRAVVVGVDSAFKTGSANDYSAAMIIGTDGIDYYALDLWEDRVEFPELLGQLTSISQGLSAYAIEDTAAGQSAIQVLRRVSAVPVLPVKVTASKQARAQAITPIIEAGKLKLPARAAWTERFINQMCSFPTGQHDDMVDACVLAISTLSEWLYRPKRGTREMGVDLGGGRGSSGSQDIMAELGLIPRGVRR